MARYSRWLIFAPVAILALFATVADAEPVAGLNTTYYAIDTVPPTRSDNIYTVCGSEVENNINRSYDGEPFLDCTVDLFMVHMTGFITIPEHDTIEFWLATDDGGNINIDGNEWGDWWDQGCTWMESGQIDISAGSQPLNLWMYENGGGTCVMLAWNIDGEGFEIVPDEAFTTTGIPTDTTIPDTTIPDTTTTVQETTTTWESTTTSTIQQMTTSTIAPSTTVTVISEPTSTTLQTTSTYPPEPTMPEPPATVPLPQIEPPAMPEIPPLVLPEIETYPPETLNLPPDVVDTLPELVVTYPPVGPPQTLPFVGELPDPPDTMPPPPDTLPDAPELPVMLPPELVAELPPELVEALTEAAASEEPLTDEQFDTAVEAIADLAPAEAVALVAEILATAVTPDQAEALATNPEVLAVITEEQATEIFETIEVAELDATQVAELTAAIQDAPVAVQEAFEETIDVFGGFDDYVPTGSDIPVGERRTLIAVAAGTSLTAAGSKIRRK